MYNLEKEQKRLEKKLVALEGNKFIPPALLQLVSATARMQVASRANVSLEAVQPVVAADAHALGAPLLPREQFPFDPKETAALFGRLLGMMAEAGGTLRAAAKVVHDALEKRELRLEDACNAFIADDPLFYAEWGARLPDAPSFVRFLTQGSLTPSFQAVAAELAQHHNAEEVWEHGHCPVCGSQPIMSHYAGKEGARHLTCSFCRHEYRAKRIHCPYCNEEEQDKLEYFTAEGERGFSVHVCRTCSCYIKCADFRELDKVSIPVLDDLESLTLDILAREQGYTRPVLSAWGF